MDIRAYMRGVGQRARVAARALARAGTGAKNQALLGIADSIERNRERLEEANSRDLQRGREHGLDTALLDRLELTVARVSAMSEGLRQIAALADPVGEVTALNYRPTGIQVGRMV